jgi:hypothetical protein
VLAGLAFALAKMLGARSARTTDGVPAPSEPWPPLRPEPPAATPVPAPVIAVSTPVAPAPVAPEEVESDPEPVSEAAPAATKKAPPKKAPVKKAAAKKPDVVWVEPSGDVCPTSHPVKAKLSSKIFHLPGMLNYERTRPDRCYRDAGSAEADGLRAAKR